MLFISSMQRLLLLLLPTDDDDASTPIEENGTLKPLFCQHMLVQFQLTHIAMSHRFDIIAAIRCGGEKS